MKIVRPLLPLLFLSIFSFSQDAPMSAAQSIARPQIGVVLEGGGALGLAHIGVLKWMQEHHVPVDSIAGTSMGGLVAGLYATGMSPDDIEVFVKKIDWGAALSTGGTPYRDLSFRRKEDKRDYPADLQFGLKKGIGFPSGLSSGQEVSALLDRAAAPYFDMKTFDDLPTPFRCVASDLVTQKKRTFDSGSVPDALRATMSLPGVFSPVQAENHIYIDGGLVDNLPVDAARSMGAQKIIAVHLRVKPLDPKQNLSAFDVLEASVSFVIAQNEEESLQMADTVVSVPTEDYTMFDYDQASQLIQRGYDAAEHQKADLERLAVSDAEWSAYQERRRSRKLTVPVPAFIEVTGTEPVVTAGLQKNLTSFVGKPLDYAELDGKLRQIVGLGRFSQADYRFVERNDATGLAIHVEEKGYAPPTVDPVIYIDGSDYTDVRLDVGARITLYDLGGFGSEWRNDLVVGSDYGVSSEYYHPFSFANPFFVAPRLFAFNSPEYIYRRDERIAEYRSRSAGGGLDLGVAFSRFSQLRFGYQGEHVNLDLQLGQPQFKSLTGRQGFSRVRFDLDTTDDPTLPRHGFEVRSRAEFYDANPGATEHFPLFETRTAFFEPLSQRASMYLTASGGTTAGHDHTGTPQFSVGGPTTLGAYSSNELLTNQYFLFQAGYFHRLGQLSPLLGDNVYLIGTYEIGKAYHPLILESRLPNDVNIALLVQTIFGPIVVGGSVGDSGHRNFYVQVGRYFTLPSLKFFKSQ